MPFKQLAQNLHPITLLTFHWQKFMANLHINGTGSILYQNGKGVNIYITIVHTIISIYLSTCKMKDNCILHDISLQFLFSQDVLFAENLPISASTIFTS